MVHSTLTCRTEVLYVSCRTLVNGVSVTERVQVKHGGRILLGNNHLYRLSCPATGGQSRENELMDYEQAMKEISINELTNGGWLRWL